MLEKEKLLPYFCMRNTTPDFLQELLSRSGASSRLTSSMR